MAVGAGGGGGGGGLGHGRHPEALAPQGAPADAWERHTGPQKREQQTECLIQGALRNGSPGAAGRAADAWGEADGPRRREQQT